jgi:hypothetical protein
MYRVGSRIRVRISAPGGDQPIWAFAEADPSGQANVAIGYGGSMPSRLLLPVVPGVDTSTGLPPCPGLRGEPCRDYVAFQNQAAPLTLPGSGNPGSQSGSKKKCKKHKRKKHKRAAEAKKKKHKKSCKKKRRHHKRR